MVYAVFTASLMLIAVVLLSVIAYFYHKKCQITEKADVVPYGRAAMAQMKGLATLIVVLGHLGNLFGINYLTPLGSCGVMVFLFASGYGLECSASSKGVKGFWKKRLITAYLPYFLFEACTYPLFEELSFKIVVLDLLLIDPAHPYGWYMQCLFLYYIAFYIGALLEKKLKNGRIFAVSCMALVQFIFFRSLYKQQVLSFLCGMLIARFASRIATKKTSRYFLYTGVALVIGIGALALRQLDFVRSMYWVFYFTLGALQCFALGWAVIFAVNATIKWQPLCLYRALIWIGVASYEIYLFHGRIVPKKATFVSLTVFSLVLAAGAPVIHYLMAYIQKKLTSTGRRKKDAYSNAQS